MGTEDVFLGLSDKDISNNDSVLVKVWLPNTKFSQVQLDVKQGQVIV